MQKELEKQELEIKFITGAKIKHRNRYLLVRIKETETMIKTLKQKLKKTRRKETETRKK